MEETAELRHMLMSFRVSELQTLLGFAGRSKSGRKHELMGRSLQLLKCEGNYQVRAKIRELYRARYPRRVVISPQKSVPPPRSLPPPPSRREEMSNSVPVHPDVRLVSLPFFEHIDDLVRPTSLVPVGMSQLQENYVVFHLTPRQVGLITTSRDNRPHSRHDFTVQIQLRICLLETSCEQSDNFPSSLCIKVNGKICSLPGYVPPNASVDHKRPGRPVNITNQCRLSSTVPNHIHVSWTPRHGQRHVVVIRLVRLVTSSCLMQRLKARGYRNPDHSRALIKEKLAHDPDSEVATTSLRVTLLCPLGKSKMTLPCRSVTCSHLQCFDAALYLQMNEKKTTWICPVCDQKAEFKSLVLDGLFREILDNTSGSCTEISFYEDGSWRPAVENQELESKAAVKAIIAASPIKKMPIAKAEPETKEEVSVIDLTEDTDESDSDRDDDEDMDTSRNSDDLYAPISNSTISSTSSNSYNKRVSSSSVIMPPSSHSRSPNSPGSPNPTLFSHPSYYPPPPLDFQGIDIYRFLHTDDQISRRSNRRGPHRYFTRKFSTNSDPTLR
ncbi:E3 SUMO-protein ligase PIAS2 isoform X2 [Nematostella vectensis]|uniref:E3 SUMO-protein ligase PIAS2 isoform X2 n=1 Tax=Nematostella vectensis TaxID=45351 RepID=UPI002076FCB5|nr:E3 SUMO-protein ligase PIAS2 isoform X2 [Nematostella vectensis]